MCLCLAGKRTDEGKNTAIPLAAERKFCTVKLVIWLKELTVVSPRKIASWYRDKADGGIQRQIPRQPRELLWIKRR